MIGNSMVKGLLNDTPTVAELTEVLVSNQNEYGRSECHAEAINLLDYDDGDSKVWIDWDGSGGVSCSLIDGFGNGQVVGISHLFAGGLAGKVYVDAVASWAKSRGVESIIISTTWGTSKGQMKVLENLGFSLIGLSGIKKL